MKQPRYCYSLFKTQKQGYMLLYQYIYMCIYQHCYSLNYFEFNSHPTYYLSFLFPNLEFFYSIIHLKNHIIKGNIPQILCCEVTLLALR